MEGGAVAQHGLLGTPLCIHGRAAHPSTFEVLSQQGARASPIDSEHRPSRWLLIPPAAAINSDGCTRRRRTPLTLQPSFIGGSAAEIKLDARKRSWDTQQQQGRRRIDSPTPSHLSLHLPLPSLRRPERMGPLRPEALQGRAATFPSGIIA